MPGKSSCTPSLQILNGEAITRSKDVAAFFGREHHNVIKTIEALEMSQEYARVNFHLCQYQDSNNRWRKSYNMTRDGFTLLAMGFTGSKAMAFKIAYIEAFNRMEAELRKPKPVRILDSWDNSTKGIVDSLPVIRQGLNLMTTEDRHNVERIIMSNLGAGGRMSPLYTSVPDHVKNLLKGRAQHECTSLSAVTRKIILEALRK